MAEWVSHLIVADRVLERLPQLKRHEFCVGNIAPDCNIPNEDGTDFIPPRKVTHWITGERKTAADASLVGKSSGIGNSIVCILLWTHNSFF